MRSLNGLQAIKKADTILVPLPPELWERSAFGRCDCGACNGTAWFDTMAIDASQKKAGATWLVHAPRLHGLGDYKAKEKMEKNCERAYEMERTGYVFLDADELTWLADHIKNCHPEQWKDSTLNKRHW